MKILIVGAGITGLALACFLRRDPTFQVDIIEKSTDWSGFGFTIGILGVGRRMLGKLGLEGDFDRLGYEINSIYFSDTGSEHLEKLGHFDSFYKKYEKAYTHISRKDLHRILLDHAGVKIQMGMTLENITQTASGAEVILSDGTRRNYDLVVGADGINSKVRELVFPSEKVTYTGNRVWFAWIPRKFVPHQTMTEIVRGGRVCNLFDDPTESCMVLTSRETPKVFDDPKTRMARLGEKFADFGPPLTDILNHLKGENFTAIDLGRVDSSWWVNGRVLVIGDAAHAMEPFAGLGASMGMEDAYVLADELSRADTSSFAEVEKALSRYSARRLPRVRAAMRQTRLRHLWLSSSITGLSWLLRRMSRFVPIRWFIRDYEELFEKEP
ncbi:MAG: FAD-binding monooxygenase [Parcubacteria group bacterium Gr01-1014_18]|nr:MAG: FAD-binding monooxygenase [Parcubacteria group bacterium Greene0416_36]TSC80833.1 MAG: FAD-binding monooxygenase [Parcubacteria group bacterium Gr01-1014_18]TSC99494.1 MAG: FAD-binding monooxygenase [Parcubacteria group bacterium Greene1014_20]TSD07587.1 MAG: FAD-binding monooxygenase [Parcubacteria group bacterium Greene0714_2]